MILKCPTCRSPFQVDDSEADKSAKCPTCGFVIWPQDDDSWLEWKFPLILLACGFTLAVGGLGLSAGPLGAVAGLLLTIISLVTSIPIAVGGLYAAARLLGISFGNLGPAILKLAAITVFVNGILAVCLLAGSFSTAIPLIGTLIASGTAWALFAQFFHLDFFDTFYSLLIIGGIEAAVVQLIRSVF
jgi:hypothetical protein